MIRELFDHHAFENQVIQQETSLLSNLNVQERLSKILETDAGRTAFAEAFYFVRYDFYRLNFIVGARSDSHERNWTGLVHSLYEEAGGVNGRSHNQLYRDFLAEAGIESEYTLKTPTFARKFNKSWEDYCVESPFAEALSGLAIFEILDRPDYAMLLEVVKSTGVSPKGRLFFRVHAEAEHFDFFEEIVCSLGKSVAGRKSLENAAEFVNQNQKQMWKGLLRYLSDHISTANKDN